MISTIDTYYQQDKSKRFIGRDITLAPRYQTSIISIKTKIVS